MAAFYTTQADGSGVVHRTDAELVTNPVPGSAVHVKYYDQNTNPTVAAQFAANSANYTMLGAQVLVSGVAYEFEPDGLYFAAKDAAAALLAKAKEVKAGNATFSSEDFANIVAIAFHGDGLPST